MAGIIGHDGDTIGQSAYLRLDPKARVAACLLTNSPQSETLYREVFSEVFGALTGVTVPAPPSPGPADANVNADLGRYAGRYEHTSRRLDVSVRGGRLRVVLTVTGNLAALTDSEPEELFLHPADPFDSSSARFVLRSRDDEPWVPLSFGQFGDGTPYVYLSGRVTPRVRLATRDARVDLPGGRSRTGGCRRWPEWTPGRCRRCARRGGAC